MGKFRNLLVAITTAIFLYNTSCAPPPAAPTPTPTPLKTMAPSPTLTKTPVPTATYTPTPTLDPIEQRFASDRNFETLGYTAEQLRTYSQMPLLQKMMFYELADLGGRRIYEAKLTPDSIEALWNYLSTVPMDKKSVLSAPGNPLDMMGSTTYVLDLSDNASPYLALLPADTLEEKLGLDIGFIVDNSKAGSPIHELLAKRYADPFQLGVTVQDRLSMLEAARENPSNNILESGYGFDMDMAAIEEAIIKDQDGRSGPVNLYIVVHNHMYASRMIVNGLDTTYGPEEFLSESFFENFKGRHINVLLSTCPYEFIEPFVNYLEKQPVTYTLLTSFVDPGVGTALEDMGDVLEVAANINRENRHPIITPYLLSLLATGQLVHQPSAPLLRFVQMENSKIVSPFVEIDPTYPGYLRYIFHPYMTIDGERKLWEDSEGPARLFVDIVSNGETAFYPVVFPEVYKNLAILGLNLKKME